MNDDDKRDALAAAETTYFPPPQTGAGPGSDDRPPETVARASDSTLQQTREVSTASPADESQIATLDLPPEAPEHAGSTTSPTLDWSAAKSARQTAPAAPQHAAIRQVGEYDVVGELGRGGMGVVYQARHRQLGRVVALKMIRSGAHADADELDRFLVEAQAVARLQHPGIVQIFDIGQHDGLPYFSLEFVAGRSLLARVAKEPLEPREAAELVEQLARAMQYAHDQGILHRDLKPANVLLTPEGKPKITDFGLAKHIEGESASTQTGSIMGTPSYMSPEQASGNNRQLTPATDQYALGAVLYHLVTGRPPFLAAKAVETLLQVLHNEPVPPRQLAPKLPIDLETICLKALQKDAQRRYESCGELAADLRRYLDGEPIVARPVSLPERAWRWCRRNPRIAIPTAASILLFLVAFGISAGSAWALASLNADLEVETKNAQTQAGIARQKAKEASDALRLEEIARQRADNQTEVALTSTDVALTTIKRVFTKVQAGIGRAPQLQPFKKDLIETAANELEKLDGLSGTSGITAAATKLAYHEVLAQLHRELGDTDLAWNHLDQAHKIARQRIIDQNGSNASRHNLALICRDMAQISLVHHRDMDQSLRYALEAEQIYQEVLAKPKERRPGDPLRLQIMDWLADTQADASMLYVRMGQPAKAIAFAKKTERTRQQVLSDAEYMALPEATRRRNEAGFAEKKADSSRIVADLSYRTGKPEQGRVIYDEVLAHYDALHQKYPANVIARQKLLGAASQAGYWRFVTGSAETARPLYERALSLAAELAVADPDIVDYQAALALCHYRLGILKESTADLGAQSHFDACLTIRAALAAKDQENDKRKLELLLILARTRPAAASGLAREILGTIKPDIELLLDLARAYAQCSAADKSAAGAEAYRLNAIYCLQEAVRLGHQDKVYLATEPDFTPLRQRDDFRALAAVENPPVSPAESAASAE